MLFEHSSVSLNSDDKSESSAEIKNFKYSTKNVVNLDKKIIGDYQVEKTLGQGTFGKVKQGFHVHTG